MMDRRVQVYPDSRSILVMSSCMLNRMCLWKDKAERPNLENDWPVFILVCPTSTQRWAEQNVCHTILWKPSNDSTESSWLSSGFLHEQIFITPVNGYRCAGSMLSLSYFMVLVWNRCESRFSPLLTLVLQANCPGKQSWGPNFCRTGGPRPGFSNLSCNETYLCNCNYVFSQGKQLFNYADTIWLMSC